MYPDWWLLWFLNLSPKYVFNFSLTLRFSRDPLFYDLTSLNCFGTRTGRYTKKAGEQFKRTVTELEISQFE